MEQWHLKALGPHVCFGQRPWLFYVPAAQVARQLDHRSLGGRMELVISGYVKVP